MSFDPSVAGCLYLIRHWTDRFLYRGAFYQYQIQAGLHPDRTPPSALVPKTDRIRLQDPRLLIIPYFPAPTPSSRHVCEGITLPSVYSPQTARTRAMKSDLSPFFRNTDRRGKLSERAAPPHEKPVTSPNYAICFHKSFRQCTKKAFCRSWNAKCRLFDSQT